jgi:putative flippase GtrA
MPAARRLSRPGALRKLLTYAGGSLVATICSEATLVVLYGLLHVAPASASVLAWVAGAVPNYWLNRSWTWQRRGRPDLRREVLPYAAVIGVTLLLATLGTKGVDVWLRHAGTSSSTRVVLVAATFLGVYVVMFVLRFLLLDRLFGRLASVEEPADPVREEVG